MKLRAFVFICFATLFVSQLFSAGSTESTVSSGENQTISIEHALGTAEVPVNPANIAVFNYDILDVLHALQIPVAATVKVSMPTYLSEYAQDENIVDAGTLFEPDYEALFDADIDVIFISDRQASIYEELSQIAPVVYTTISPESYMESIEQNWHLVGEIFSRQDETEELIQNAREQVAEITGASSDKSALFVLVNDGSLSVYGPGSRFGFLHGDFGFAAADDSIEVSRHGQAATFEYLASVNPDILFVLDRGAALTGVISADTVLDNDIVNATQAALNDNIIYVDAQAWYLSPGGVQSTTQIIQDSVQALD